MLTHCTLTGIDRFTDLDRVARLAAEHPVAEFGILASRGRAGLENRYPELDRIEAIADVLLGAGVRLALHICGDLVTSFVQRDEATLALARRFGRVQLNFAIEKSPFTVLDLDEAIGLFGSPVITQHNQANQHISTQLRAPNHQILFDASCGRGERAAELPAPFHGKACGFAGGFGPATIASDLADAARAADGQAFWIDMESRVRMDDVFDLDACERVLQAVA